MKYMQSANIPEIIHHESCWIPELSISFASFSKHLDTWIVILFLGFQDVDSVSSKIRDVELASMVSQEPG